MSQNSLRYGKAHRNSATTKLLGENSFPARTQRKELKPMNQIRNNAAISSKEIVKMTSEKTRTQENIRMAGFLEKKGKMKFMSHWKKYWFVLEERLLLYYRSEVEYTNLSPCRGSLNMGLVSTVRPGSSSGPCVIHVITRTQVVELRAKNRASQEKWLEALLHSMALPVVTKTLPSPPTKPNFVGCGCSLDNITARNGFHPDGFENEWTLPRKLEYGKRQISGTFYGGSLDTAIWSKKFKPVTAQSPNASKGKLLEKILGFSKECENSNAVADRSKESRLSLCEGEMRFVGKHFEADELCENNAKCKVHDENRNHDLYSAVDKNKKQMTKTLSDTELNKSLDPYLNLDFTKIEQKDESAFERIKNVLVRIPKDNILKGKSVTEKRTRSTKKRRQSFLQKVFKKKDCKTREFEFDSNDPLYDTIDHLQEQTRSSIPVAFRHDNVSTERDNPLESIKNIESLYAEVQKPVAGSKTILPAKTMSELKLKLRSRENFDGETAPTLPPRRVSRPVSPWHDVPTNNAPVGDAKSFFVHQAMVKFNSNIPAIDLPKSENEFSDTENDLRFDLTEHRRESFESSTHEKKNDDLSMLLEQLTKITVAPLAEPELTDDNYNSSSESKFWSKSQFSEPDYDIPRPHRPMSIVISEQKEIISSTEFMGRCDNNSDTGSSLRSMEPDSLETGEKK